MGWKSFIYPQNVARYETPFNHDVRVVETGGKLKLLVNGSPQSGPYIESLWKRVFKKFGITSNTRVRTILVLGVGGGTVIELLSRLYPESKITSVDVDPQMIKIGKKFFHLDDFTNVSFIVSDAKDFVAILQKQKKTFDLIIVDLFIGRFIPSFVYHEDFLITLKHLLNIEGKIVINFLGEKEYKELSNCLLDKLHQIFHSVKDSRIFLNRFFIISN